jgi:hypothetical protein
MASGPDGTFKSVTGTFVIPTAQVSNGQVPPGTSTFGGSAWIGIDGATSSCEALAQAGVSWLVINGVAYYEAFIEWYPDGAFYIGDQYNNPMHAGDTVTITIDVQTPSSASATIQNQNTGIKQTWQLSSGKTNTLLCQASAEWIVEDFGIAHDPIGQSGNIPFANFGSIEFSNAIATQTSGATVIAMNAGDLFAIAVQDEANRVVTFTTLGDTQNSMRIEYIDV